MMKNLTIGKQIRENKLTLNMTHPSSYYGGDWGEDDFGTSHLSLLAENGDAVAATATINYRYVSYIHGRRFAMLFPTLLELTVKGDVFLPCI